MQHNTTDSLISELQSSYRRKAVQNDKTSIVVCEVLSGEISNYVSVSGKKTIPY